MPPILAFLPSVGVASTPVLSTSIAPALCTRKPRRWHSTSLRFRWSAARTYASADLGTEATADNGDDSSSDVPAGTAPAPTAAGVSTIGLPEKDAFLLEACYEADVKKIEDALEAGGSIVAKDVNQRTPLHFCAGNGLDKIARDLVARGAEVNAQDILGLTPLHMATGYKRQNTVDVLVEVGADANIACYGGELPVELGERLLEGTPEKKFFSTNPEWETLKSIVDTLDDATEEEDDDDEDGNEEKEEGKAGIKGAAPGLAGEVAPSPIPGIEEEETVGPDGAKVVVRVREKTKGTDSSPVTAAGVEADVKVTIRSKKAEPVKPVDGTAPSDATVVVRRPGEK